MRFEGLDLNPHPDALAAVIVGALLATVSVVVSNQLEAFFRRRDRERSAALLMGEVLATLRVVLMATDAARAIGDPYGPVTTRMLQAARREIDFYERNREALLDLRDARLRVDVHSLVVKISMPLDGVLDSLAERDARQELRDQGFVFMMSNVKTLPGLIARLGAIAHYSFDQYDDSLAIMGAPPVLQTAEERSEIAEVQSALG